MTIIWLYFSFKALPHKNIGTRLSNPWSSYSYVQWQPEVLKMTSPFWFQTDSVWGIESLKTLTFWGLGNFVSSSQCGDKKKKKKIMEDITLDSEDLAYKWFNTMRHQSLPLFIITPHSSMHGNLNEAGTQEQSTSLMRPICKASVSRIMPSVDHSSQSDWCGALGLIIVKGPQ